VLAILIKVDVHIRSFFQKNRVFFVDGDEALGVLLLFLLRRGDTSHF
jgi:hypothetical protein